MAAPRRIIVLGLGSFGGALVRRLHTNGIRVTGVDADRDRVELCKDALYEAVIASAIDRDALEQLSLGDADVVAIALGEDISQSLLATLHVKELGAKRILVKGVSPEHARLLKHVGAERVVIPEEEMAIQVADGLTWPNMLDLLRIDREYSVMELAVPDSCVGESIRSADLRRQYGAWVVGVKDVLSGKMEMFPDPEFRFGTDQIMLVIGKDVTLEKLRKMK